MHYGDEYSSETANEDYAVDWRSAGPKKLSLKLKAFSAAHILKLWKRNFLASCYSILERLVLTRTAEAPAHQEPQPSFLRGAVGSRRWHP